MKETMKYLDTCNADELREAIEGYRYILSKPSLRGTHEMVQEALDYATTLLQNKFEEGLTMSLPRELSEPMEPNATMRLIEELDEKYGNAIPIFGGALWIDSTDTNAIVNYLPSIVRNAQIWKWHGGLADACRQFCHCLFVDPMLIEACIGMTFEKLTEGCYV